MADRPCSARWVSTASMRAPRSMRRWSRDLRPSFLSHRDAGTEVLRFPPVMSRAQLEKSGYLKSFPNLLGCVCALHGSEAEIKRAVARHEAGGDWTTSLTPADLVLSPAACYPVYPIAAARGAVPDEGYVFDIAADVSATSRRAISTGCSRSACANMSASAARTGRRFPRALDGAGAGASRRLAAALHAGAGERSVLRPRRPDEGRGASCRRR